MEGAYILLGMLLGCYLFTVTFMGVSSVYERVGSRTRYAHNAKSRLLEAHTEAAPLALTEAKHTLAGATLASVADPAFVVYGNQGYRDILGSFVCNMALFPSMHRHILVVATDEETSQFLRSLSSEITVMVVSHQGDLHDAYDFETPQYLRLMLARGLVLVELLEEALTQGKTLVWLEPDFHYTQSLLRRPEMMDTTSDLVFYMDHAMYCGCFVRFAPVLASLNLYKEVMRRMHKIHSEGGTTNDQVILNEVAAEQQPNFTVFDRCLYRSGTYNHGEFMAEYQLACRGVRPVAQHHNWIVGAESKVQRAKDSGGWFLAGSACQQRDLLLVVMTMDRPKSLERLIRSLQTAPKQDITAGMDLRVTVDRDYDGNVNAQTMEFLDGLQWPHGIFEVIVWPAKVGLYGQWLGCWPAEQYHNDTLYKAVLLLEDDLEVSPHFAKWFIGAHAAYEGVGAITGQRPNLVAAIDGPPSVTVPPGVKAFGYLLMATWSLSPKPAVWKEFRQWAIEKRKNSPEFVPLVPGIVPNRWYEHFRTRGEGENMWEMWYIRFADERTLHTVYPWVEGGAKTMVGNWMETGLHFSGKPSLDFPIATEWDQGLLRQHPLPLVGYDLNFSSA